MFGGSGLYLHGAFFGIVFAERLYFKTDDVTRPWYEEKGMGAFRPNERQELTNYLEVPGDVIEDPDELIEKALEAAEVVR